MTWVDHSTVRDGSEERIPPPPARPHLISSDAEAIEIARSLAPRLAEAASARDRDRILPWDEIELFTASGLGGMTVPRQLGWLTSRMRRWPACSPSSPPPMRWRPQIPQNQFGVLALVN